MIQIGNDPDPVRRRRVRQGSTIRKVRRMREMSIEQLAKEWGVTVGAVSQWECGRFTPARRCRSGSLVRSTCRGRRSSV